jgi:GNAT superfamily N-acetyltransferase
VAVTAPDVEVNEELLSRRDLQEVAAVAARAFHTDPFFIYLSPNALQRSLGLGTYFHATTRHLGPTAKVLTARSKGRIVGVAGWVPPGGYPYPARDQAGQLVGALRAMYRVPPSLVNGLRYLMAIEKVHPKEEHWYLQLLACDPEHQRQGVGTALLEGVLATCDAEGMPAYLETQKEDNLAYYRRFGFEPEATLNPVRTGPPLWTMRRSPRASAR